MEDFPEDTWKTLRRLLEDSQKTLGRLLGKSSNVFYARIPRSVREVFCSRWYKEMMSSGVQAYLCGGIISSSMCNYFVYGVFYDLYMYYFSCEFFCKLEEMLIKRIWYIFSCFPKVLDIQHTKNFLNHSTHS